MTDAAIGVIGTLAGTVLGFGSVWVKEYIDEKRAIDIDIENLILQFSPLGDQFKFIVEGTFVAHNKSTIRKPFYGVNFVWHVDPIKTIFPNIYTAEGKYGKLYQLEPKTSEVYTFKGTINWDKVNLVNIDELRKERMVLRYRSLQKPIEKDIIYKVRSYRIG